MTLLDHAWVPSARLPYRYPSRWDGSFKSKARGLILIGYEVKTIDLRVQVKAVLSIKSHPGLE